MSQSIVEAPTAVGAGGGVSGEDIAKSPRQLFWLRFKQDKLAFAGAVLIVLMILAALSAPFWAHVTGHGVTEQFRDRVSFLGIPLGPTADFWFGSDELGRDLFVRVLYGAQVSLKVALIATGLQVLIGMIAGVISGYVGGWADTLISRLIDLALALPFLLVGIALATTLNPGQTLVIAVIVFFGWPYIARIVRGQVLSLKQQQFVEAARAMGASSAWIMFREVTPNLVAVVLTYATLIIPINIIGEATLSFLGVGIQEPTPSWGTMLSLATDYVSQGVAWWYMAFPGMALLTTVLAFNLLGDGLRDALDPRTGR
jgi:peptide/nickel transport system permease protein